MIDLTKALDQWLEETQDKRNYHRDSYKANQQLVKHIYNAKRTLEKLQKIENAYLESEDNCNEKI